MHGGGDMGAPGCQRTALHRLLRNSSGPVRAQLYSSRSLNGVAPPAARDAGLTFVRGNGSSF